MFEARTVIIALVVGMLVGLTVGYALYHPDRQPVAIAEPKAPEIHLPDKDVVIARDSSAPPPKVLQEDVKAIDKKAKLERSISFDIHPKAEPIPITPPTDTSTSPNKAALQCEPQHIDLGLVRLPDGSHRVVVSSNGDVVNGVDVPVDLPPVERKLKWSVGALWNATDRKYGAMLQRDLGPFRFGVGALQIAESSRPKVLAEVAFRF